MLRAHLLLRFFFIIGVFAALAALVAGSVIVNTLSAQRALRNRFEYAASPDIPGVAAKNASAASDAPALSLPVLYYHGIPAGRTASDTGWQDFKDQMLLLKKNGYETIGLQEAVDFLHGKKELPRRSFLLTFDDNRKDSFYPVDPVLKALNYRAVTFVISGTIDQNSPFHLTRAELKKMLKTGRWEIASHSRNGHGNAPVDASGRQGHWFANRLWRSQDQRLETDEEYTLRVRQDLLAAKRDIEGITGAPVTAFALPFGDYGQNATNHPGTSAVLLGIARSIYGTIFYQSWNNEDLRNTPGRDTVMVRRIGVEANWSADDLLKVLNSSEEKDLPFLDDFSHDSGWINNWGESAVDGGRLRLSAKPDGAGATALLQGTEPWRNYSLSAHFDLATADSFSLLGRAGSRGIAAACVFKRDSVGFEEKQGGLASLGSSQTIKLSAREHVAGMRINNGQVSCSLDGKEIVKDTLKDTDRPGRIGISIWGKTSSQAVATVTRLETKPL